MPDPKWTPEENAFLMKYGHRVSWDRIAASIGRTPGACQAHFNKIRKLRIASGTWKGL